MKRSFFHLLGSAVLALGFFSTTPTLAQETIVHPPFPLQDISSPFGPSLAPTGSADGKSISLSGNSITLDGGGVGNVFGAMNVNDFDAVTENRVFINNGAISGNVSGGEHNLFRLDNNPAASATATNNTVAFNGGTAGTFEDGITFGGWIFGGYSFSKGSTTATDNSVTIRDGMVMNAVYGGQAWTTDAETAVTPAPVSSATNNQVTINGGTVKRGVYGGHAENCEGAATATNNHVTISGGTVGKSVIGGYALSASGDQTATNNTVTIRGAPVFEAGTMLLGGDAAGALTCETYYRNFDAAGEKTGGNAGVVFSTADHRVNFPFFTTNDATDVPRHSKKAGDSKGESTGNTLNLHSGKLTVAEVNYFQNLNFYLPANLKPGDTMLTVTGFADIADASIKVSLESANPSLKTGDRFVLIRANPLSGNIQPVTGSDEGFAYKVTKEGNSLVLTIGDKQPDFIRDYTGQWISADGEDAWGLSILMSFDSNPRYLFAPWYTYDRSGKASWYIFQGDTWTAGDTITADVYRYTGPAWGTHDRYNNSTINSEVVGTATLTFTSETTATFQYNVEDVERTIVLNRLDGERHREGSVSIVMRLLSGQWVNVDEDAWGLTVLGGFASNPDHLFIPWFTYDKDGNASWYVFQGDSRWSLTDHYMITPYYAELEAEVYRYTGSPWGILPYDNNAITKIRAGTAKLILRRMEHEGIHRATFEYDVEGSKRTIELRKLN